MQPINQLLKKYDFMNLLKNLSKDIIAPIIVLVVGGYSLYHFTKQDESREINPHSNSGIINNMSTNNGVINNITTGITNQGIQLITQPYQERITTLEQKLTEVNTSQITLSKELTTTRKRLKQKQQEIDNLKLITPVATFLTQPVIPGVTFLTQPVILGVTFLTQPVTQLLLQDFDHTPWEQQQLLLKVIDDLMLEGLSWVDLYQHFIVK